MQATQSEPQVTPTIVEVPSAPQAPATASAAATYEAARAVRNELRSQLDALVSQRHSIMSELEDHDVSGPAATGMQARIAQLDGRITELDIAIAKANANVALAAAVPGAVVERPSVRRDGPPEEAFFTVPPLLAVVFFPIAIAYARRIWKRTTSPGGQQLPSDLSERLSRLEAMGETTALEVERIGEGQRFVTRLLTERPDHALGEGERVTARHV